MAPTLPATNLGSEHTERDRAEEHTMYPSLIHTELAASRRQDLIAAAEANRLVQQARRARRDERRNGTTPPVRRTWVRSATQPAHS